MRLKLGLGLSRSLDPLLDLRLKRRNLISNVTVLAFHCDMSGAPALRLARSSVPVQEAILADFCGRACDYCTFLKKASQQRRDGDNALTPSQDPMQACIKMLLEVGRETAWWFHSTSIQNTRHPTELPPPVRELRQREQLRTDCLGLAIEQFQRLHLRSTRAD